MTNKIINLNQNNRDTNIDYSDLIVNHLYLQNNIDPNTDLLFEYKENLVDSLCENILKYSVLSCVTQHSGYVRKVTISSPVAPGKCISIKLNTFVDTIRVSTTYEVNRDESFYKLKLYIEKVLYPKYKNIDLEFTPQLDTTLFALLFDYMSIGAISELTDLHGNYPPPNSKVIARPLGLSEEVTCYTLVVTYGPYNVSKKSLINSMTGDIISLKHVHHYPSGGPILVQATYTDKDAKLLFYLYK